MTQNIYDDEGFFRGYSRLPRSVEGLDAAPGWLALRALFGRVPWGGVGAVGKWPAAATATSLA